MGCYFIDYLRHVIDLARWTGGIWVIPALLAGLLVVWLVAERLSTGRRAFLVTLAASGAAAVISMLAVTVLDRSPIGLLVALPFAAGMVVGRRLSGGRVSTGLLMAGGLTTAFAAAVAVGGIAVLAAWTYGGDLAGLELAILVGCVAAQTGYIAGLLSQRRLAGALRSEVLLASVLLGLGAVPFTSAIALGFAVCLALMGS